MATGTVVRWNSANGFGFVRPDTGDGDLFTHVKDLVGVRSLEGGQRVFYVAERDYRRRDQWKAASVTLIPDSTAAAPQAALPQGPQEGTMKWFNPVKRYGFIAPDRGGRDVFVHIEELQRAGLSDLNEGDRVRYTVAQKSGKPYATNLSVVGFGLRSLFM